MTTTVSDDPAITETSSVQERSRLLHLARGERWPCPECTTTTPSQEPSAEERRIQRLEEQIRRQQQDIASLRSIVLSMGTSLVATQVLVGRPR